jgi:FkbM family methyltransferase
MTANKQGYRPSLIRKLIRLICKLLSKLFFINGQNFFGNVFLQTVNNTCIIKNPIDTRKRLIFRAGHERLYWRIKNTSLLEEKTLDWIKTFKKKDIFLDIGSNIGFFSLVAAQARNIYTLSFELDPLNYALQHENIFLNNLQNKIFLIPLGLSNVTAKQNVYYKTITPGDALHSLNKPSPFISAENKKFIKKTSTISIKLDDFYSIYKLSKPDHIKIDVDGIELLILKGSLSLLKSVKTLMVEISPFNANKIDLFLRKNKFKMISRYGEISGSDDIFNCLYVKSYY